MVPILMSSRLPIVLTATTQAIGSGPTIVRGDDIVLTVKGSCSKFSAAAQSGITAASGKVHPSACGVMSPQLLIDGIQYKQRLADISANKLKPPYSLDVFRDDPSRGTGGYCARAYDVTIDLSLVARITRLEWMPGKVSSSCQQEALRINKEIAEHENDHLSDFESLLQATAAELKQINVVSCAGTREEATAAVKAAANTAIDKEFGNLVKNVNLAADLLDMNKCSVDCSKCKKQISSYSGNITFYSTLEINDAPFGYAVSGTLSATLPQKPNDERSYEARVPVTYSIQFPSPGWACEPLVLKDIPTDVSLFVSSNDSVGEPGKMNVSGSAALDVPIDDLHTKCCEGKACIEQAVAPPLGFASSDMTWTDEQNLSGANTLSTGAPGAITSTDNVKLNFTASPVQPQSLIERVLSPIAQSHSQPRIGSQIIVRSATASD